MKQLLFLQWWWQNQALYIPHGSDETQLLFFNYRQDCLTLYPTRFRWNKNNSRWYLLNWDLYIPHGSDETNNSSANIPIEYTFISHTVQMKHSLANSTFADPTNFISHTVQMKPEPNSLPESVICLLYIPHGSDETLSPKANIVNGTHLYIPHGSDETFPCSNSLKNPRISLYPTRFRWNCKG